MKLLDSRLFILLSALSTRECTQLGRFLASPYFNQREDVIRLWEVWQAGKLGSTNLQRKELWSMIYPEKDWDGNQLRLVMSYLTKLVEQFIAVEATLSDPFDQKMKALQYWRRHKTPGLHQRGLRELGKVLDKSQYRDADHFLKRYQWQAEGYRQAYTQEPEKASQTSLLASSFDQAFIAMKLRQNCLLLAHDQVYQWGYQPSLLDQWLGQLQLHDLPQDPTILTYWYCSQMLSHPEEEGHFRQFKTLLVQEGSAFPPDEARDLQLMAINYGIRKVNEGEQQFFHDIMDLYRAGLEQRYLLRDGTLSRFTYHNIVAVALQIDLISWAESFIEEWTSFLERPYRDRMYNFSRAKIAYADRRYGEALPLLQQANYHDPLLNLGARALLLKIYFELDEWDVLQSHLDAFQNYLRRKAGLGYHRANYQNLIKYTRRLLRLKPKDKIRRERLYRTISQETTLTEKEWLLVQLENS